MKVRQSTLGGADKCLRSMQYDIENNVYHGGSIRALGTAYHAGLEYWYQPNGETKTLGGAIAEACRVFDDTASMTPSHESELTKTAGNFRWDDKCPDHETAYGLLDVMLTEYITNHVWPDEYRRIGTELSFSQDWRPGHTRNGSIDLTLESEGWIIGVDFKTAGKMWPRGKEHHRKQNQSNWYTAALMEMFPGAAGYRFVFEIMTYAGKFDRRIADVTPESIAAFDRKAEQVVGLYTGMRAAGMDLPANPASTLCNSKWCDHFDICEFGSILES